MFIDWIPIGDVETFGQRVRRLREERGWTQAELAKRAGFAYQSAIGNIEAGKRDGSRNVAKLAEALGVDAHYLETGKGPPAGMSPEALEIARLFDSMPPEEQTRLRRIIAAAIGPAVPDETVERRMPITRKPTKNH